MAISTSKALRVSASAGSGKTFTLTRLYLQKAMEFPGAFRGIVAITFTNKAVEELKERILNTLNQMAHGDSKAEAMAKALGFSTLEEAREPARRTLSEILHDFDRFQISTIDSFFQQIFSQLAYEINLPQGLSPDLDINNIKSEVLQLGLQQMDAETQDILIQNLLELLGEKGKGWRTVAYLESELLANLFQGRVMEFQYDTGLETYSGKKLAGAKQILRLYADNLETEMRASVRKVVEVCRQLGYSADTLKLEDNKTFLAELAGLEAIANSKKEIKPPTTTHQKGEFHRKPKGKFSEVDQAQIAEVMLAYAACVSEKRIANMNLARKLAAHLSASRLLLYFKEILNQRNRRLKRYLLQEVQYILKGQVEQSVVPYLFEKLGTKIHTFLMDEFQDTSLVQWKVISPLAKAILDEQGQLAMVGDVKQSIYSWRGGDSTLFKSGIDKDLYPNPIQDEVLDHNFRSQPNIVAFNNWLFAQMPRRLYEGVGKAELGLESEYWAGIFEKNYQDLVQKPDPRQEPNTGFVHLRLRSRVVGQSGEEVESEEDISSFSWIIAEIRALAKKGVPSSEIAILVRNNSHIRQITSLLDQASRQFPGEDFRFNSTAEMLKNEHPMMRFLFLALTSFEAYHKDICFEMESLAASLGLEPRFHMAPPGEEAVWRADWKVLLEEKQSFPDWSHKLETVIQFFRLTQQKEHHFLLVEFQNLVFKYQREEYMAYPDFRKWWQQKAGNEKLNLPNEGAGIQILTIHKSKGLDFGVVILAIEAHSASDRWSDFLFWPQSNEEPWNAFPLMQANGVGEIRHSDFGVEYSNEMYVKVLESLNTWYVACTRPRYGLIIDIRIDNSWAEQSKSTTRYARMGYLIPRVLQENETNLEGLFPGSLYTEERGPYLLEFQFGKLALPKAKKNETTNEIREDFQLAQTTVPVLWSTPKWKSKEGRIGELAHLVLEKSVSQQEWPSVFQKLSKEQSQWKEEWQQVEENLTTIFRNEAIQDWFSGKYTAFPEQELLGSDGKSYRVDRILKGRDEWVVLDFKTGMKSAEHQKQIQEYARLLGAVKKSPCRAFLVYTHIAEVEEVGV